jgi:hypothetical protein
MAPLAPARLAKLSAAVVLAVLVAIAGAELVLRVEPRLLPGWYLERFPLYGAELFDREAFEHTPVDGLPLPIPVAPHVGPPPSDLKGMGLVPEDEDRDARDFPRVVLPVDELGLPNERALEAADLLLVGDSFAVSAGMSEPPGLQARLAVASGLTIYNLGVAGIGASQELYLLETVGLPKAPRAVVWLFFAGNDTIDALVLRRAKKQGATSFADLHPGKRAPALVLPDLVRALLRGRSAPTSGAPLAGLALRGRTGTRMWFNPGALLALQRTSEEWRADKGWIDSQAALLRAREMCDAAGAQILFVYVPSKEQVYLPHVEPDAELLLRMLNHGPGEDLALAPAEFLARALERRGVLEACFAAFCEEHGLAWMSATPCLEELARAGELAYLTADTHWQTRGQAALFGPLLERLRELGVVR